MSDTNISPKSRLVALLLCFFLGVIGLHRFYVGKNGTGILMIVTFGGLGIWVVIDLVMIIVGSFTDKQGRRLYKWAEPGSI
jgi:TM2 domain-containing membrane protein YozV